MTESPKHPGSRISIPPGAHPFARLVFYLMREQEITYQEMEFRSGLLKSSLKAWRQENVPSLQSIEAALGALGWGVAPHPRLESLPAHVREMAEELGQHFFSDDITLATAVAAAMSKPARRDNDGEAAPRLVHRGPYWRAAL